MENVAALAEELEKELASSFARIMKERLGKGPGGTTIEGCGNVLMVTMHQTLTPFERTLAEATEGWGKVVEIRGLVMRCLATDLTGVLQSLGLEARLIFGEIDVTTDRQLLAFRVEREGHQGEDPGRG